NGKAGTSASDETMKSVVRDSLLCGTVPVIFLFGVKAWDWREDHSFYSHREYWFGQNTEFGGADKGGHFLAHYMLERSLYQVFNWTEDGGSRKWIYSIGMAETVGLLIEVGDGFSSHYGFSYEDFTVDSLGIIAGAILDRYPVANAFVGFSGRYIPTQGYIHNTHDKNRIDQTLGFVNDYSGWTFMANFKLAGFEQFKIHLPLALRLVQLDLGYRTKGYTSYDKGKYARPHRRDIVYGISLNTAQLFDESLSEDSKSGGAYIAAHKLLEFYHVPIDKEFEHQL
ncbi:MAG TPA: DUF2279 domain-containing protein, partial [Spirochaetota bacterium]